jgi:membrane protein YdbS with pleckstrin-like domain
MNIPSLASLNTPTEIIDNDESKLCEVSKHPFGIVSLYIGSFFGIGAGLALSFFLIPAVVEDTNQAFAIAMVISIILIVLAVIVLSLATLVYRQNRLIVTDRNITQILQYGLFSRKVSQLNMVNVEDVTFAQNGFLPTLLGYGELSIETAGEQSNFSFIYCPRPGYYAKIILNAREKILGQQDGSVRVAPGIRTSQ